MHELLNARSAKGVRRAGTARLCHRHVHRVIPDQRDVDRDALFGNCNALRVSCRGWNGRFRRINFETAALRSGSREGFPDRDQTFSSAAIWQLVIGSGVTEIGRAFRIARSWLRVLGANCRHRDMPLNVPLALSN
jgi:hypothetical protein